MQQLSVELVPLLRDNYVFVLHRQGLAAVVDPALAEPVIAALERQGLELVAILHTHHHSDHIGGTPGLLARWPGAAVLASREDRARIPLQTRGVAGGDRFELLGETVQVIDVPGHTRAHIAYYLPVSGHLFCGDTLFAGGCGRLFEGSAAQMRASLQRLAELPAATPGVVRPRIHRGQPALGCRNRGSRGWRRWADSGTPRGCDLQARPRCRHDSQHGRDGTGHQPVCAGDQFGAVGRAAPQQGPVAGLAGPGGAVGSWQWVGSSAQGLERLAGWEEHRRGSGPQLQLAALTPAVFGFQR